MIIFGVLIAYLLGGIPTGYLFAKLLRGIDIREQGSGNVGATNVFRVVGKREGIIALVIDALKGAAAVMIIPLIVKPSVPSAEIYQLLLGAGAIAGHIFTPYLRFRGGKGVATTLGVFLALAPQGMGIVIGCWLIVFILTHYVSFSSIIAAIFFPVIMLVFCYPSSYVLFSLIVSLFIIYKHRANLQRLITKHEKKIF